MMRRSVLWCLPVGTLVLAMTLAGCGEDEESPAICSAVDSLKSSVDEVTDLEVDRDSLATLQDDLDDVREDLSEVKSDAADEFGAEIDTVEQAASSLTSSIDAAIASPTPETIATVGTAVQGLGASLASLDDAVESTC